MPSNKVELAQLIARRHQGTLPGDIYMYNEALTVC